MKPTITNAFTVSPTATSGSNPSKPASRNRMRGPDADSKMPRHSNPAAVILSPMQADLREADFGFSLELSPIQAIDAVHALLRACPSSAQFLVSVEQSAWRDGNADASLAVIAERLGITPTEVFSDDQLALSAESLAALVAIAQPHRLLVIAIDGPVEEGDAQAINRAIDGSRSPLAAELRALAALEVLGDRSVVLHARDRSLTQHVVAQNFRHYLAAVLDKPAESFVAPEINQMELLLSVSGAITVRPIETSVQAGSIDIGVNTSPERFAKPANLSLIYDRPSNSWHAE